MLGKTDLFWKLANVIWNCSCNTLILIKCWMSCTAKLISPRAKTMLLHLGGASQVSLVHQCSGESAGFMDLKASKQLISLEVSWALWGTDSCWDCSSMRTMRERTFSLFFGDSQTVCSNTLKSIRCEGFRYLWKHLRRRLTFARLSSGFSFHLG